MSIIKLGDFFVFINFRFYLAQGQR